MRTPSTISHRIAYLVCGFFVCVALTYLMLAPGNKPSADYQYMHCKTCKAERPYDARFADMKCLKCSPQKDAAYVPTVASTSAGGGGPWKWFNVAASVELLAFLGLLVYLLKPRSGEPEVKSLFCNCPQCKWRLRFRETSAGRNGQCPRCQRVFQFPEAAAADSREFPALKEASRTQ